jgi:beta-lactamase class D
MTKTLIKYLYSLCIFILASNANAETINYSQITRNSDVCFILYDANKDKIIERNEDKMCSTRMSPSSTFKVPLAVMGYDAGILIDDENPKWAFKQGYIDWVPAWKADQTPRTWIQKSAIWYSQLLTSRLGMPKIKSYLAKFNYGNQDMTGNLGKKDGLTMSWLGSSLRISPDEQLLFLKNLFNEQLPVTHKSMTITKDIMYAEELEAGWKLYGKTGTVPSFNPDGSEDNSKLQSGWYIGWISKDNQTYIFVLNMHDKVKVNEHVSKRAKAAVKKILNEYGLLV